MIDTYYKIYMDCKENQERKQSQTDKKKFSDKVWFIIVLLIILAPVIAMAVFMIKPSMLKFWIMIVLAFISFGIVFGMDKKNKRYRLSKEMELVATVERCRRLKEEMKQIKDFPYPIEGEQHFTFLLEKAKEKCDQIDLFFSKIKKAGYTLATTIIIPSYLKFLSGDQKLNDSNFVGQFLAIAVLLFGIGVAFWYFIEDINYDRKKKYLLFIDDMETIVNIEKGFYPTKEELKKRASDEGKE
ncbi:MAG TPA: hypothetical protein P5092_02600 [Ruminococcus sp.]|nr:hypothetical protein [Ruminococcus sp.]